MDMQLVFFYIQNVIWKLIIFQILFLSTKVNLLYLIIAIYNDNFIKMLCYMKGEKVSTPLDKDGWDPCGL